MPETKLPKEDPTTDWGKLSELIDKNYYNNYVQKATRLTWLVGILMAIVLIGFVLIAFNLLLI